jgi:hypothetical protein
MLGLTRPQPPPLRDWIRCSLIGIGVGAVVLGIGSRAAMRGIAVLSGAPGGFSFGGSLTVVLLGALSGLVGAWVLMALRTFLPRRWLLQTLLFYAILILISLRGLRPVDTQRLFLFMPLVLVYAFLLRVLSRRRRTLPQETAVEQAAQA